MEEVIEKPCKQECIAAKKCADYDSDCTEVKNHFNCWTGGVSEFNGELYETKPVDGYCPYVFGMK